MPESHSLVTTPTHCPVSDLLTECKDGRGQQPKTGRTKNEAKEVMQATKVSDSLLYHSLSHVFNILWELTSHCMHSGTCL